MTKLLIIAGPQSSGKTTVFNLLKSHLDNDRIKDKPIFLPEVNQNTLTKKGHLGGAFVTKKLEKKIIEQDLEILRNVSALYDRTTRVITETGIFHLAYLERAFGKKLAEQYFKKYLKAYRPFHPIILFLDTKPEVSWKRRKPVYLERLKKVGITDVKKTLEMLKKYRQTIENLYPLWLKWYKNLPFEKYLIKNSYKKYQDFLNQVLEVFDTFIRPGKSSLEHSRGVIYNCP